ncbi:MAG TPA: PEP-utilizing enzyme [Acidimicrobiales bacterium]|nr:PEP-utilizing enzyme [Acidimicrobiales bacterium]
MTITSSTPDDTHDAVRWEAPGPGTWTLDRTHNVDPLPRFMDGFLAAYGDGFSEGFRLVGAPLDRIEAATVNGWLYTAVRPLGGRPDGGGPPPRWLMSLLFRVHPELRRRHATARRTLAERGWTSTIDDWERSGRPSTAQLVDRLHPVDLTTLTDDELGAHVQRCSDVVAGTSRIHFAHAAIVALVSGQLIVLAARHRIAASDALAAVTGWSSAVRRPNDLADAVVDALRAADALDTLDGEPVTLFDRIRSVGPAAATTLDAYLREIGPMPAGGISVADATILERPELVATTLRRRIDGSAGEDDLRAAADRIAEDLADRIGDPDRAVWRQAVDDARRVAPVRDQTGALVMTALGTSRLALLEVGRRLVARDWADAPDDAVDLLDREVRATLSASAGGSKPGPDAVSAEQLAARVAARRRNASLPPPDQLGPDSEPPPLDRFPDAIAELSEAVFAFVSRFESTGDGTDAVTKGLGIGDRPITGRAVVVHDLTDLDRVGVGDVLVATTTSPAYNTVLTICGAVVTEVGGSISHAAIMARELGLSAIVGYPDAMQIPDGTTVTVDPTTTTVTIGP